MSCSRTTVSRRGSRRAALLLEAMLALTLFVGTALMILAILGRSLDALDEARQRQTACDLARSAMSRIEAGIASPESLNGPAQLFDEPLNAPGDDRPVESEWELVVETEPSLFDGLTLVTVTARRAGDLTSNQNDSESAGERRSTYTLRQLVRLSDVGEGLPLPGGGS